MLRPQTVRLDEVQIRRPPPITIRNDTLEFDATAFATRPNTLLEDLLRKLPGVDVNVDGSVRAQGKTVQQVFVNGKPFFGTDPTMATRNLPAELIDKIQVVDNRSDQSTFSGVDDGTRVRTINIVTRPEGRQGIFGQQVAGYGTDGRYQVGGGINRFREQQQLSVLGQTNNINQSGYSLPTNGGRSSAGGSGTAEPSGSITQATGAGLNYADQWGRTELAASYVFGNTTTQSGQRLRRQTILPATGTPLRTDSLPILVSNTTNQSTLGLRNDQINLRLTFRLDSMNTIRLSPGWTHYRTDNTTQTALQTLIDENRLINEGATLNSLHGGSNAVSNTLLWTHRFARRGRTFSLNLSTNLNRLAGSGFTQARNQYYAPLPGRDSLPPTWLDQLNTQHTRSATNELTVSYTEPLTDHQTLEAHYAGSINYGRSERLVFDVDSGRGPTGRINPLLSNAFQSQLTKHRGGVSYQQQRDRHRFTVTIDGQHTSLQAGYPAGKQSLTRRYVNLLPGLVFQPQLGDNQYVQFQYQTRTTAPSVTQLQPVANVTNPLFVQVGNPALRPEYTHGLSANYNRFHTTTYRTVFALLNVELTRHRIVTATTIDGAGVQTLQPVNANGYATVNGTVSLSRPLRLGPFTSTLNLTTNLNLMRGLSFINGQTNRSLTLLAGQRAGLNATLANSAELSLSGTVNYQSAAYSLIQRSANQSLATQFTAHVYYPVLLGFGMATDFTYSVATGRSAGYNQPYALWNASVSRSCLNQRGEWRLQVFDLLNQNRSLVRNTTDTYVEDVQSQVLKRYVLISFSYNLRRFGSDTNRGTQ